MLLQIVRIVSCQVENLPIITRNRSHQYRCLPPDVDTCSAVLVIQYRNVLNPPIVSGALETRSYEPLCHIACCHHSGNEGCATIQQLLPSTGAPSGLSCPCVGATGARTQRQLNTQPTSRGWRWSIRGSKMSHEPGNILTDRIFGPSSA